MISRFVKGLVEGFASEEVALEVEQFFAQNPINGTRRSVLQGVESIRANHAWLARDTDSLRDYLNN